jgi:DNA-binding NarL/FixJ family response regulator
MLTISLRPDPLVSAAASESRRVLVVDDDTSVRTVLRELLREQGFDVVGEAVNGLEAVALAQELAPDVMVVDVRMPVLGGLEAARRIRLLDPVVRFVILSAYDDPTLQQEADDVGASAFLVKGCSLTELVEAIAA